jgi:prefoldin subunit 5
MGDNHDVVAEHNQKFENINEKIKILFKKTDNFDALIENMKEILVEIRISSVRQEEALIETKRANEQRDTLISKQSETLQEQCITLTQVRDSLGMMKSEIDETKADLKGLSIKIDDKSKEKDTFKEFVYKFGIKAIEWAISGGLAYYFLK